MTLPVPTRTQRILYYPVRLFASAVAVLIVLRELWEQEFGSAPLWVRWGIPLLTVAGAKLAEHFTGSRRYLDDNSDGTGGL